MNTLNFSTPSSSFKYWGDHSADALQSRNRKIATVDTQPSGRGSDSDRDILTLSHQGQAAYAKHGNKAEKVHQSVQEVPEPAESIPELTLNDDGTPLLTHANGSASTLEQVTTEKWVFTPGENDILALDSCPWGEVVGAYLDFRSQVAREVKTIPQLAGIMSDFGWGGIFLSHIFSQTPDVHNSSMAEFEDYSAKITQGIQELKDVLDLRQKLGLGNDFFGDMSAGVMVSIVNGKPTSILAAVIDGEKVSLGTEYINASWLRALDKVASVEGLAAARSREDAGLGLSYYDVKRGMQIMLQVAHTGGSGFSFKVMEFSLQNLNDKGTVIAHHSGNNFSEWLNSSSNSLSKLYDADFQDWLGMMKKRVVGWW